VTPSSPFVRPLLPPVISTLHTTNFNKVMISGTLCYLEIHPTSPRAIRPTRSPFLSNILYRLYTPCSTGHGWRHRKRLVMCQPRTYGSSPPVIRGRVTMIAGSIGGSGHGVETVEPFLLFVASPTLPARDLGLLFWDVQRNCIHTNSEPSSGSRWFVWATCAGAGAKPGRACICYSVAQDIVTKTTSTYQHSHKA